MSKYLLTLNQGDRLAIDWVGGRYATGYNFYKILIHCMGEDDEWDSDEDITFAISEDRAWKIRELFESEDMLFPCYASELTNKLWDLYNSIV